MGSIPTAAPRRGKFNYVPRGTTPIPAASPLALPALSNFNESGFLSVTDLRPSLELGDDSPYKLSSHCFTARHHVSRLNSAPYDRSSWNDEKLLREIYIPEVEHLLKSVTGCKTVVTTGVVLRSELYSESVAPRTEEKSCQQNEGEVPLNLPREPCAGVFGTKPGNSASPAPKVHIDVTPLGARLYIRKHHRDLALAAEAVIEAENKLLSAGVDWNDLKNHYRGKDSEEEQIPRFAYFSVWRPLKTVTRDPLGVAPSYTFPKSDYVPVGVLDRCLDSEIPSQLFKTIRPAQQSPQDPEKPIQNETVEDECKLGPFQTWAYSAYGPRDIEGKTHNWHFISDQNPSEVLIIQFFDNEMEATVRAPQDITDTSPGIAACGAFHSSFELEGQEERDNRESLEVRCFAFW
ncbi:hypothetical protein PENARI_c039G12152 [Penicillium arizonense]|uniref:GA4 desaturase n=1 Tax=Penicillium arizonense TaxID=1835702 RepID=A0A1F5L3W8_PENAI|nr:hypothetical protein PENARI_c039G12152 [Penicillium arizonense]OGE47670.1 hypothetical protein PENARI_c039G12152 [Penicillium arizonense]